MDRSLIRIPLRRVSNPLLSVFILDLVRNHILALCDLVLARDLGDIGEIRRPRCRVPGVIVSQSPVGTCSQPERKATGICFGIYIRTRTDEHVEAQVLRNLEEGREIMSAR